MKELPKIGFLYLDYVLRFFDKSNFKGWPDKIEQVVYHWGDDRERLVKEIKRKKIDILIGNIPATAYETFKEISKELPNVRFVPSIESQFSNKSKENVTRFCTKHDLSTPKTEIFYDREKGYKFLENCSYPKIVKRSYGASNYGGYYVHKVDDKREAKELFDEKKYHPMYIQDCVPLKADIRVMLIGHKPICAFWRIAGDGQWITNTSQGGDMSYSGVPIGALELASKASKAAKAEYWACDIAEADGKFYILECATAFAAFPYIRDWIGQYLMWDFSDGRFRKPHIPLYSWEELGKLDSSILRILRHIGFSKYSPSADGAFYTHDKDNYYPMERAEESTYEDICDIDYIERIKDEEKLPDVIKEASINGERDSGIEDTKHFDIKNVVLTELLTLHGMDEDVATQIIDLTQKGIIREFEDLEKLDFIDENYLKIWRKDFI